MSAAADFTSHTYRACVVVNDRRTLGPYDLQSDTLGSAVDGGSTTALATTHRRVLNGRRR